MEAIVTVPKDLANVKTKVLFNLTKRQCICFSIGGAIGLPVFFLAKNYISISSSVLLMMLVMSPMFLLAMYEWHGLALEKIVENYINVKLRGNKQRCYATNNFYRQLENERLMKKEVKAIVIVKARNKTQQGRNKTARVKSKRNKQ